MKYIRLTKKNILLVIAVLIMFTLTACSGGGDNNGGSGDNNDGGSDNGGGDSRTYDLIWWNLFEDEATMRPLIDRYQTENPNVNIRYVQKTGGLESGSLIENYRDELDSNLTDNEQLNTPDIVTIHNTWLGRYQTRLSPSANITSSDIESDFFPVVSQDFVRKSSVYAVPMSMDSLVLIANTDLMANISAVDSSGPVDNWFDFIDQAKRVTVTEGNQIQVAGFSAGYPNVEFLPEVLSTLMLQNNIQMTRQDDISGFSAEAVFADDPDAELAYQSYSLYVQSNPTWDTTFDSEVSAFLSNKLAMMVAPSWRLNDILRLKQLYNLDIEPEVYPLPQIDPSAPENIVNWADYWGLAVTSDSQTRGQSQQAWDFIKFLTEAEQLRTYNETVIQQEDRNLEILFPRISMSSAQQDREYIGEYAKALETAKTWDMVDGYLVRNIILEAFEPNANTDIQTLESRINSQVISRRASLIGGDT